MFYFASSRNQNYVKGKIVDSVGSLSNVASDDTRLRGDRNDKQNVKGNNAKVFKINMENKIDLILNLLGNCAIALLLNSEVAYTYE